MPLLTRLHRNGKAQIALGLGIGIAFGFLLQKGGVTDYNMIIGQLLLENFIVVKMMLSAVIVAMIGVHLLVHFGYAELHVSPGSLGSNMIGGLIFGAGFALLGLCPGTVAGGGRHRGRSMRSLAGSSGCSSAPGFSRISTRR